MRCTDSLENVAVLLRVKAAQWIPTQNVHIVCLGYFVPEVFDANRRLCITSRPQERRTFSARRNARVLPFRSLSRCHDEIAE